MYKKQCLCLRDGSKNNRTDKGFCNKNQKRFVAGPRELADLFLSVENNVSVFVAVKQACVIGDGCYYRRKRFWKKIYKLP